MKADQPVKVLKQPTFKQPTKQQQQLARSQDQEKQASSVPIARQDDVSRFGGYAALQEEREVERSEREKLMGSNRSDSSLSADQASENVSLLGSHERREAIERTIEPSEATGTKSEAPRDTITTNNTEQTAPVNAKEATHDESIEGGKSEIEPTTKTTATELSSSVESEKTELTAATTPNATPEKTAESIEGVADSTQATTTLPPTEAAANANGPTATATPTTPSPRIQAEEATAGAKSNATPTLVQVKETAAPTHQPAEKRMPAQKKKNKNLKKKLKEMEQAGGIANSQRDAYRNPRKPSQADQDREKEKEREREEKEREEAKAKLAEAVLEGTHVVLIVFCFCFVFVFVFLLLVSFSFFILDFGLDLVSVSVLRFGLELVSFGLCFSLFLFWFFLLNLVSVSRVSLCSEGGQRGRLGVEGCGGDYQPSRHSTEARGPRGDATHW
jgi:hypothetical protein